MKYQAIIVSDPYNLDTAEIVEMRFEAESFEDANDRANEFAEALGNYVVEQVRGWQHEHDERTKAGIGSVAQ